MGSMSKSYDINSNVEQTYESDSVKVVLDDATFNVKATAIDTSGVDLVGVNPIADKTFTTLAEAIEYYKSLVDQLYLGDVIRNV